MFRKMRKVESSTDSHKSSQIEFVQMCADLWSLSKKKLCVSALKTRKSIRRHLHNLHFYTAKNKIDSPPFYTFYTSTRLKTKSIRRHSTLSPMRTFVNMQNRFGDFRFNPGRLM